MSYLLTKILVFWVYFVVVRQKPGFLLFCTSWFFFKHCRAVVMHFCSPVANDGWAAEHQLSARLRNDEAPGELLCSSFIWFTLSLNGWGDRVSPVLITRKRYFLPSELCLFHREEMLLSYNLLFNEYQAIMLSPWGVWGFLQPVILLQGSIFTIPFTFSPFSIPSLFS